VCVLQVEAVFAERRSPKSNRKPNPNPTPNPTNSIMLDNMARRDPSRPGGVDVSMLTDAMARVRAYNAACGGSSTGSSGTGKAAAAAAGRRRVETEASGNVTLESVAVIAATGVDYVSVGALTHSVTALDISLNIETR
jgi:nicotinate-nucleotide pyrophosphorylase (carboxylating)